MTMDRKSRTFLRRGGVLVLIGLIAWGVADGQGDRRAIAEEQFLKADTAEDRAFWLDVDADAQMKGLTAGFIALVTLLPGLAFLALAVPAWHAEYSRELHAGTTEQGRAP